MQKKKKKTLKNDYTETRNLTWVFLSIGFHVLTLLVRHTATMMTQAVTLLNLQSPL